MFAAADAYDRHVGRYSGKLSLKLIDAAGLEPGDHALDVGCGTGKLTGELIALLGTDHVTAIDPSPAFVEAARAKFPDLRVEEGPAEELPFEDGTFDAALAQLVVNFMRDARIGVGEMKRVTRSGGSVVAAVWDYGDGMTLLRRFWDAAAATDSNSDPQDELNMRYATAEELAGLWTEVGLTDVRTFAADIPASYESFEDLWYGFSRGVGPAGAYAVSLSEDQRERLKHEYRRLLGVGEAPFDLSARAWVVTGRVPST
jgi:SAM-dependent methyltransferase